MATGSEGYGVSALQRFSAANANAVIAGYMECAIVIFRGTARKYASWVTQKESDNLNGLHEHGAWSSRTRVLRVAAV